jgi:hypothetical protein
VTEAPTSNSPCVPCFEQAKPCNLFLEAAAPLIADETRPCSSFGNSKDEGQYGRSGSFRMSLRALLWVLGAQ